MSNKPLGFMVENPKRFHDCQGVGGGKKGSLYDYFLSLFSLPFIGWHRAWILRLAIDVNTLKA